MTDKIANPWEGVQDCSPTILPYHKPTGDYTTSLLTGAGVTNNSWSPVIRALNKFNPKPIIDQDNMELFLTRYVYLMRFFTTDKASEYSHRIEFENLKNEIVSQLKEAEKTGEITCRDFMKIIWIDFILPSSLKFYFFTTNWDRVAWLYCRNLLQRISLEFSLPLFHIHGSIDDAATLYLPSEAASEVYRTEKQEQKLGGMIPHGIKILENTDHLIIYGLSLSALDAELAQVVSTGVGEDSIVSKITIIDINPTPVLRRLQMLCSRNVEFVTINPHKYTPKYEPSVYNRF